EPASRAALGRAYCRTAAAVVIGFYSSRRSLFRAQQELRGPPRAPFRPERSWSRAQLQGSGWPRDRQRIFQRRLLWPQAAAQPPRPAAPRPRVTASPPDRALAETERPCAPDSRPLRWPRGKAWPPRRAASGRQNAWRRARPRQPLASPRPDRVPQKGPPCPLADPAGSCSAGPLGWRAERTAPR